jgi:hypothetical protein
MDGSAFIGINSTAVSIETGHEQFVITQELFVDLLDHR